MPNEKLIATAEAQTKDLAEIPKECGTLSTGIKQAIDGKGTTLQTIWDATTKADKAIVEFNKVIAAAKTTQSQIDKVKEGANAAKALKDATTKAQTSTTALKNEAEMADKIADKAVKEDSAILARMDDVAETAKKLVSGLQAYVQSGHGVQLVKTQYDMLISGKLPSVSTVRNTILGVFEDTTACGKDIADADRIYPAMPELIKKAADAYMPEARKAGVEGQKAYTEMGTWLPKAKTKYQQDLKDLNAYKEKLKKYEDEHK